jgi:hypothetical protein
MESQPVSVPVAVPEPREQIVFKDNPNIHLLTSRFNSETWNENETYRNKMNISGCIYGAPLQVTHHINMMSSAYVIEMNNDTNRIEGIGSIRVYPSFSDPKSVYENKNYNRYVYSGKYRLDRDILVRHNPQLIETIEKLVFTGKTHMKRGAGLTKMSKKLLTDKRKPSDVHIIHDIRSIFIRMFSDNSQSASASASVSASGSEPASASASASTQK